MRDRYEEGWNDGFDVGEAAHDTIMRAKIADELEPTPTTIDPDTLTEDERAFYDAGYGDGHEDGIDVDLEVLLDAEYADGYKDALIDVANDPVPTPDDYDSYREDMEHERDK